MDFFLSWGLISEVWGLEKSFCLGFLTVESAGVPGKISEISHVVMGFGDILLGQS